MKKMIPLVAIALLLNSCMVQKPIENKTKYMTILMLKNEYNLSNDQVKAIKKAYLKGELKCSYNAGIGEVLYPEGDYSRF